MEWNWEEEVNPLHFIFLILYIQINIFSAMSKQVFHGWTITKQRTQGHNTETPTGIYNLPTKPLLSAIHFIQMLFYFILKTSFYIKGAERSKLQ